MTNESGKTISDADKWSKMYSAIAEVNRILKKYPDAEDTKTISDKGRKPRKKSSAVTKRKYVKKSSADKPTSTKRKYVRGKAKKK